MTVFTGDRRKPFYDLIEDPKEQHNLILEPEHRDLVARMRENFIRVIYDKMWLPIDVCGRRHIGASGGLRQLKFGLGSLVRCRSCQHAELFLDVIAREVLDRLVGSALAVRVEVNRADGSGELRAATPSPCARKLAMSYHDRHAHLALRHSKGTTS